MQANLFKEFVKLLTKLPPETWKTTITEGAGWKWMKPLSEAWKFGHFSDAFLVLGLNDYQTKGKAEIGYWPKVVPLISKKSDPKDPMQLIDFLEPFYSRERFAKTKLKRLKRFIKSDLCRKIWVSSSTLITTDFVQIWHSLSRTMNQHPTKKTIAFAMKCLALALLMVNKTKFDFGEIPVPVDSRIRSLSSRLGIFSTSDAKERERWQNALERIRKSYPKITMVHLDSLLWQIGTKSPLEIETHLRKLEAGSLASKISLIFKTADMSNSSGHL